MEHVPFLAWEQAVFVALFIVLVFAILGWTSKQQDKWKKFMEEMNFTWLGFTKDQRAETLESINCVEISLSQLTEITKGMMLEIREMRESSNKFYDRFESYDKRIHVLLSKVDCEDRTKE